MTTASLFLPVQAAYDRWAPDYDATDNPMVFAARHALAAQAACWAGRPVTEFGCGTGANLALLARHGAGPLRGFDLSSGMLAKARAHLPQALLWQQDMAAPTPRPDAEAALVLFSLTLEHVAALAPPLAEARRLLHPGGRILILEIHPFLSLGGIGAHFQQGGQEVRMPTVAHGFADYLTAFAATGLAVTACREWRSRDFGAAAPARMLKRGADTPILVEFTLASG